MTSISHLKALEEKATPGPWRAGESLHEIEAYTPSKSKRGKNIRDVVSVGDESGYRAGVVNDNDLEFIVAIRNSFHALSDVVGAAEATANCHHVQCPCLLCVAVRRFRSAGEGA